MSDARARPRRAISRELWLLAGSIGAFVAITVWWLTQDDRVQDWDNGLHTMDALVAHNEIAAGHLSAPFTEFNMYPPLGHLVGALGIFVGGISPASVILASNVVFVPLLAAGCYGVASLVYGSARAGLLAALFALGTPMIVSEFHEFLLDPQQAALVAVSVWATLASRRGERVWVAALAGALGGLAMLSKQTSIVFLAGPLLVALARGGWRNWRGVVAYAAAFAVIGGPWYIEHRHELQGLLELHGGERGAQGASTSRFSHESLGWYFWDTVNLQVLLPLSLTVLVGVVIALRDCLRRPLSSENLRPELLAGLFLSWLGMTMIVHKDPRYTLPWLVYMAALGTGWIATASRGRRALTVVFVLVVAINVIGVSDGLGGTARISLPGGPKGAPPPSPRSFTLYSPDGWLRGGPEHDGDILALMRGLKRVGVRSVTFDAASSNDINFNTSGLQVLASEAGLPPTFVYDPAGLGPHDAFVLRHVPEPGDPPPCQRLRDGSGVYIVLGNPVMPFEQYTFLCPGRTPLFYKRTAPLSLATQIQLHPQITGASRAMLLGVMSALHASGVSRLQFDRASANTPFFQPVGIELLAGEAQLPVPPGLAPAQLAPSDAYLLRAPVVAGGPRPCGRFPDGSGLFVVRGDPAVAHPDYRCPTARR